MVNQEDGKVDYGGYSSQELQEARFNIDPGKYPENFASLLAEFERRGLQPVEPQDAQMTAQDQPTQLYSEAAKSPIKARIAGFLTFVIGVAWFLSRYDGGVYRGKRGLEYTFDDNPIFLTFLFLMHGAVVLIGLLGLIFGSRFYRDMIRSQSSSSPFRRRN